MDVVSSELFICQISPFYILSENCLIVSTFKTIIALYTLFHFSIVEEVVMYSLEARELDLNCISHD